MVQSLKIEIRDSGELVQEIELVPPGPYSIGRSANCDVVVSDLRVSREQGTVRYEEGNWWFEAPRGDRHSDLLGHEQSIRVGAPGIASLSVDGAIQLILVMSPGAALEPSDANQAEPIRSSRPRAGGDRVLQSIGRSPDSDLVMEELVVSRKHAELRARGDAIVLTDCGSHLGTFVDGTRIASPTILAPDSRVTIGSRVLKLDGRRLSDSQEATAAPALQADHLNVTVGDGIRLLDDVSFAVPRGQLMAVVGPTGAGKSTLLKAVTGFRPPDAGDVFVAGRSLYANFDELRPTLGYVPQEDILHPQLSVRRALQFGAELRFPPETTRSERDRRVDEVMEELGLAPRADLAIQNLSGGQRKRTNVALELLTKPSLLVLDEPTSGLDPGYERTVMELLRDLANGGRALVVVTHSLASLDLCDQVLFLAPGGRVAYLGPPAAALTHFGQQDYPSVFRILEADVNRSASPTATPTRRSGTRRRVPTGSSRSTSEPPSMNWRSQVSTLVRRQVAILIADRKNLVFLALSSVIPALLILLLVGGGALNLQLSLPRAGARTLLGALVVTAAALGAANGLREIVKEQSIYLRERAVGLRRSAYLCSKIFTLGAATAVQCVLLVVIAILNAGGPESGNLFPGRLELIVGVAACGVATLVLGLVISALVSTSEKAMALIPVVFVASWLFSGVAVDLQTKPAVRDVAYLSTANWGVGAVASSANLDALEANACNGNATVPSGQAGVSDSTSVGASAASRPRCDARWSHGLGTWLWDLMMLIAVGTLLALGADWALARKEPLESDRRRYALAVVWRRVAQRIHRTHRS